VKTPRLALPTRVITYAWGERYVHELLSYTIPALLAPGNLPYVAAEVPCELVILSEQRLFETITNHKSIKQAQKFCKLRLISLDDLVLSPDSYGLALTFALHRGFADLGPAMTESWQIFLNADFILAQNSLKALLDRLMKGERLVASPSYCVDSAAVIPELRKFVDAESGSIAIPPRELAELALKFRHNTVIGKTLNQNDFHFRYADQFYWEVNSCTLIGHQMPVAIVGMRPEMYVAEPNSFWDHGLIKEFCPTVAPCVLGDSDDFLMIELRDKDVSRGEIIHGLPFAQDLAEKMILWVTPYQRDFARYPLILHSENIPENVSEGFEKLKTYVGHIFSFVPDELPSHLGHPQWAYHSARFAQTRERYFSEQIKLRLFDKQPPILLKAEQEWWQDEVQKNALMHAREKLNEVMRYQVNLLKQTAAQSEERLLKERIAADEKFIKDISSIAVTQLSTPHQHGKSDLSSALVAAPEFRKVLKDHSDATLRLQPFDQNEKILEALTNLYKSELETIDQNIAAIENTRLIRLTDDIPFAAIFRRMRRGPTVQATAAEPRGQLRRIVRNIYHTILGKWPVVRKAHPLFSALQPLRRNLEAQAIGNAQDILFVGDRTVNLDSLVALNGIHAWTDIAVAKSRSNFGLHTRPPQFDVCVCDLSFDEISQFPELYQGLRRFVRSGGTIIAFHLNNNGLSLPTDGLDFQRGLPKASTQIFGVGNPNTLQHVQRYQSIISSARGGLIRKLSIVIRLGLLLPRVWLAASDQLQLEPRPGTKVSRDLISLTIVTKMLEFDDDDGSITYARVSGIYIDGVEAPVDSTREVPKDVAVKSTTKIILTFGQSNAANSGEAPHNACNRVHVFNPMDGKFYRAADPLPGASNHEGSVWSHLGDMLVDAGESSVLFVPIAFGGTYIKDWAPGGNCYRRLIFALHRMRIAGLEPTIMCWHQGEADANHTQITSERYVADFIAMLKGVRSFGVDSPIYCAIATLCEHGEHPYDNKDAIRAAQQRLIAMKGAIRPGPDTDRIGVEYRRDGCHLSAAGQRLVAQAWFDAIKHSGN
jgi:hypothetical protein